MVTLLATIITNPADGIAYVGENLGARLDCFAYVSCTLNWGDGSQSPVIDDDFIAGYRYHVYRNPGRYTLHLHRSLFATPIAAVDEYKTVSIVENRSITMSTTQPGVGHAHHLHGRQFPDPRRHHLGHGRRHDLCPSGQNIITHTYQKTGNFTVRAFDWNGSTATTPVTLALVVHAQHLLFSGAAAGRPAGGHPRHRFRVGRHRLELRRRDARRWSFRPRSATATRIPARSPSRPLSIMPSTSVPRAGPSPSCPRTAPSPSPSRKPRSMSR